MRETGIEEDEEGEAQPVVFTERLKSGYSGARNDELRKWLPKRSGQLWDPLGPDNLGGRVTCLVAKHGSSGNGLLAGAACGGVWSGDVYVKEGGALKQRDGDGSDLHLQCKWKTNSGNDPFLHNIGALGIDRDSDTVYCGTGHAYRSGDSFPGVGLFRSEDNGETWNLIKAAGKDFPQRISTIAVDGERVWIGGVVLPDEEEEEEESDGAERSGIFHSNDRGATWCRQNFKLNEAFARKFALSTGGVFKEGIFKDRDYQCHSIVFVKDAARSQPVILAAITASLNWGGIWRSEDGGESWEQLSRGLPAAREFGRTSLSVAGPANIIYAFAGATDGRCLGVFRSCDMGDHWVCHGARHFAGCGSLNYVNCLAVSPYNPDIVVCGARDLHRSTDGGLTWTQVTEWFAAPDSIGYSHADHHALLWPKKDRLYSANDGGVDVSHDNGITWRGLSSGLAIAMFYDVDVAASFGSKDSSKLIIAGGTQDNASVMTDFRASGIGYVPTCSGVQLGLTHGMAGNVTVRLEKEKEEIVNLDGGGLTNCVTEPGVQLLLSPSGNPGTDVKPGCKFVDILYGDGGWTVFDPEDPVHVYGSSQNMAIYRHRRDNGWQIVTPADATDEERGRIWMAMIAMHPSDPNIIFTGSTRVWRTKDDGVEWTAVSDELDGSPITAIEIANKDSSFIYVGTEKGNIFKSEDGGNRWTDEPGENRPKPLEWRRALQERLTIGVARTITRIEAHPENAKKIAVTLMGFDKKYWLPHVLWFDSESEEKNKDKTTWIDLSNADKGDKAPLPNLHHNVVTWDEKGEYLFVGNDIGVWALKYSDGKFAQTGGRYDWVDISAGLPNALVTDLVYHKLSNSLTAATYGRSLYWANENAWKR
ncbi:MAG TPA: hypothetical protein VH601_25600 [Bryobacteraceae bacterium]